MVITLDASVTASHYVLLCSLWNATCACYFTELTILGPKCTQADCVEPATHVVHWPTGHMECCDVHTAAWRNVADRGLGMHLHVERMYYTTGEDDAVQRFRGIELD